MNPDQSQAIFDFGGVQIELNGRGDLEDFAKAMAEAIFNSAKRVAPPEEQKPMSTPVAELFVSIDSDVSAALNGLASLNDVLSQTCTIVWLDKGDTHTCTLPPGHLGVHRWHVDKPEPPADYDWYES